jgi:hypothetical protein
MAQLLLQQGKVPEALEYFEKAAELSRTEAEIVNALSGEVPAARPEVAGHACFRRYAIKDH